MDFPTFFLGLLKEQTAFMSAIAWPLTVGGIALLFRKEVRVLLGRVASIRSPFANVELKEDLAATQAAVASAVVKSEAEAQDATPSGKPETGETDMPAHTDEVPASECKEQPAQAHAQSDYLKWLSTYRRLGDGRDERNEVGFLIGKSWVPIERLIADMHGFVTGVAFSPGLGTADKAMSLAKVGVISKADAEAVVELDALTGRLLLSQASLEELSALDRYERMAYAIRKLLQQRWARLKNLQNRPPSIDSTAS
ncbi:hypothetical protein D3C87_1378650 [compost metagenome]